LKLGVRIAAAAAFLAALILLAVPLGRRSPLPPPAVVHGRSALQARSEAPIEVGAARMTIEVPRGAALAGYAGRRRAASDGQVYARALVLRSGEVRAVLVALDALLISGDLEEEVLRRAQLPPRTCLLLAATHTHSGPGGTWDNELAELAGNGRFDRAMRDAVAQAVADAIRGALGYLRTGRFAVAQVEWGDGPAVVRSAGPVDPTLLAIQARDEGGLVVATLVVYGMHPTVLPPTSQVPSGDWPGAAARVIEQETQAPALVLQGAGGNATWSREGLPADGAGAAQALGTKVAHRALDLLETAAWADGAPLACAVTLHSLPPAQASARVPWPLRRAASNFLALWAEPFAVRTRLTLGGVRLGGVPGEPVGSLALGGAQERFIGLADGYVGYVEDPARAERGEGESLRTYNGPGLARSLDLLEER
jgi:neutral ceramidase